MSRFPFSGDHLNNRPKLRFVPLRPQRARSGAAGATHWTQWQRPGRRGGMHRGWARQIGCHFTKRCPRVHVQFQFISGYETMDVGKYRAYIPTCGGL